MAASLRVAAVGLGLAAAALPASGCMTTRFLMTDYEERTESQWLQAFLIDIAIGGALVGTSFLLGNDGQPEPWTLSAGAISAGMAIIIMPLASYPDGPVMDPRLGARFRGGLAVLQSDAMNGASSSGVAPMIEATRSR